MPESTISHPPMHPVRRLWIGVVFLGLAFILTANVSGWTHKYPGQPGLLFAGAATFAALVALLAGLLIEHQIRTRQWLKLALTIPIAFAGIGYDYIGTKQGFAHMLNSSAQQQQATTYQNDYDRLQSIINDLQTRIDAVPPADLSGGWRNDQQAVAAREGLVAPLRTQLDAKIAEQARLSQPAQSHSDPVAAKLFAVFAELLVTFGLFISGWKIPGTQQMTSEPTLNEKKRPAPRPKRPATKRPKSPQDGNVIDFGAKIDAAYRLSDQGVPQSKICEQTGLSKGALYRVLKQRRSA